MKNVKKYALLFILISSLYSSDISSPELYPIDENMTTDKFITFSWSKVMGASEYQLWINDNIGVRHNTIYPISDLEYKNNKYFKKLPNSFEVGEVKWWVRAIGGNWSDVSKFFIKPKTTQKPTKPKINYVNVNQANYEFVWEGDSLASWYYIWIQDSSGYKYKKWYKTTQLKYDSNLNNYILDGNFSLKSGKVEFWVLAWNYNGYSKWSEPYEFVLDSDLDILSYNRWSVYDNYPLGATIFTKYDEKEKKNIIEFQGDGLSNGYLLKNDDQNINYNYVTWSMNFDEDFIIYITINTNFGRKYITYHPWGGKKYMLGNMIFIPIDYNKGTWQTFNKNIPNEINSINSSLEFINIVNFAIRGNGKIEDKLPFIR